MEQGLNKTQLKEVKEIVRKEVSEAVEASEKRTYKKIESEIKPIHNALEKISIAIEKIDVKLTTHIKNHA